MDYDIIIECPGNYEDDEWNVMISSNEKYKFRGEHPIADEIKRDILLNKEKGRLYDIITNSEPHGSAIDTLARDVSGLQEQCKEYLSDLQDEALFGMHVVEKMSVMKDELNRAKEEIERLNNGS